MNPGIGVASEMTGVVEDDKAACHLLTDLAQREMCAFVMATIELFGLEIVSEAEDIWLDALNKIDFTMPPNPRVWRMVTIQAGNLLAAQVLLRKSELPMTRLNQVSGPSGVVRPGRLCDIVAPAVSS